MFGPGVAPVLVLSSNTKRESGRKVQIENINAAKAIADVIRTCLGPRAMLKMLMDPMGGIVMTNDGNAILREITVQHPAGKSIIEIARTQDEEVGDGTTSVIVLAGEMLAVGEQFLEEQMHPTIIIGAYRQALEDMILVLEDQISVKLDVADRSQLLSVLQSCIGTKFIGRWSSLACNIALDAVNIVSLEENGRKEIDIKRYARIEKIPGGTIEDSTILKGVMVNKDVTHPKMRRYIKNPRIILLDCSLEYKKGESQTNIEIMQEADFTRVLQLEEEYIEKVCSDIITLKPDVVFTEKGISDLAQHFLLKAGISALRRLRKSDNNRIARACGATIVNRTDELKEEDVGTGAGLFEIKKINKMIEVRIRSSSKKKPKHFYVGLRCLHLSDFIFVIFDVAERLKAKTPLIVDVRKRVRALCESIFSTLMADNGQTKLLFNSAELKEYVNLVAMISVQKNKIGDEYFCYITECKDPKACTILLRGASKDVLMETERNLQDALHVARNIMLNPKLVPGGGAVEMAVSHALMEKSKSIQGVSQWPYKAVAQALEIIPRTLAQNCGANTIRTLTALRAKHASNDSMFGINGETGEIVRMDELKIWEPLSVKLQTYKTAVETAILLLRIDDIVSGSKKKDRNDEPRPAQATEESMKE